MTANPSHLQNLVIVMQGMGYPLIVQEVDELDTTLGQHDAVPQEVAKSVKYKVPIGGKYFLFNRLGSYVGVTWTDWEEEENFYQPPKRRAQ